MHMMGYALAHDASPAELEQMHQMMDAMPFGWGTTASLWQFSWLMGLISWLLITAFLVAAIRWMWKKSA